MSILFSLGGLPAYPQIPHNPHYWRTSFVSLSLASLLRSIRLGSRYQEHKVPSGLARFLRSVKGYTKLDKIRSEVIRKELEISGIQDVRSKHKQNWINHLERMDTTRLPKHALNYKPRGRRDRGRPRKRW